MWGVKADMHHSTAGRRHASFNSIEVFVFLSMCVCVLMLSQSDTFDCRSGKVTNRMNIALLLQSIITGMYQMYTDIESGPKQGWSWVQKTQHHQPKKFKN